MVRRAEVGFFSFTEVPPRAHRAYNEWHQLDHLPEQHAIEGIARGDRWVVTPACAAARLAGEEPLARAQYLTLYLVTEPVDRTLAELRDVAARLRAAGRFFAERESHLFGAWRVTATAAAPRVLVGPDVVPWRPATGAYVVVERDGLPAVDPADLVRVDGVAGCWTFERDPALHHGSWRTAPVRIAFLWLDGDPLAVADALAPVLRRRWAPAPGAAVLAGPLETITPGRWTWFD